MTRPSRRWSAACGPRCTRSSRPSTSSGALEQTLDNIVELAADELESWEIEAIKDPRNWPRAAFGPATAIVVGSGAAVGLVRAAHPAQAAQAARPVQGRRATSRRARVRDAAREALKVFDELTPDR